MPVARLGRAICRTLLLAALGCPCAASGQATAAAPSTDTARERDAAFQSGRAALNKLRNAAYLLKSGPPGPYVAALSAYTERAQQLAAQYAELPLARALRDELATDLIGLGDFHRFTLHQAQAAIACYRSAEQFGSGASFAIADTYQFDLHDKARALEKYQHILAARPAAVSKNTVAGAVAQWTATWMRHQIAYLQSGKRFEGSIGPDDVSALETILFGTEMSKGEVNGNRAKGEPALVRAAVKRRLDALAPSAVMLLRNATQVTMLPDDAAILDFLQRSDPAGYASAAFFGVVSVMGRQPSTPESALLLPGLELAPLGAANPLRMAAQRFFEERKIVLIDLAPDPRMASPAQTWALFIASLKSGDLDTAMKCMAPTLQDKFGASFKTMSAAHSRAAAESFGTLTMNGVSGPFQEGVVVRGNKVGMITFVNTGSEWKINEM